MKVHIGVDAGTGLVHSMTTTAANKRGVTEAHNLLHGEETVVWGDAGYQGVGRREENRRLQVDWQVAMRPGKRRKLDPESDEAVNEKRKASVRAKSLPSTPIGGGASIPQGEAGVRLWQGALPRTGQEHPACCDVAGAGQPDDRRGPSGAVADLGRTESVP